MSSNIHEVIIKLRDQASAGIKGIKKATDSAMESIERHREGIQKVALTSGAALVGMGAGIGAAIKSASDLGESVNAVNVVFGDASEKILKFGESASKIAGLSAKEFNELAVPIGALLQNMGMGLDATADNTTKLTQRAADMASVFNVDVSEALGAIQAGLRGEADPLERFGVGLNDAAVTAYALENGLAASKKEITDQIKIQARLGLLYKQTSKLQGDFVNTSDSLANSQRIISAEFKNMTAKIGNGFLPIVEKVMATIRPLVEGLSEWIEKNPQLTQTIIIGTTAFVGLVAVFSVIALMLPSITAGFSLLTGVVGALFSPITLIVAAVAGLYFAFKTNFLGIRDFTMAVVEQIKGIFVGMWQKIQELWNTYGTGITTTATEIWENIKGVFVSAFEFLGNLVSTMLAGIQEFWKNHGEKVLAVLNFFWEAIKMQLNLVFESIFIIIQFALDTIKGIWEIFAGIFTGDWSRIWGGVKQIFAGVWNVIKNTVRAVLDGIRTFIKNVFGEDIVKVWDKIWNSVGATIESVWNGITGFVRDSVQAVVGFIEDLIGKIQAVWNKAKAVAEWASTPVKKVEGFAESYGNYFQNVGRNIGRSLRGERAKGGGVQAGQTYLVGEKGPELFTAPTSGTITPNHEIGNAGNKTININMGGVVVQNEADENRLVEKIKGVMYDEYSYARLGL